MLKKTISTPYCLSYRCQTCSRIFRLRRKPAAESSHLNTSFIEQKLKESQIKNSYHFETTLRRYSDTTVKKFLSFMKSPASFFDVLLPKISKLALETPDLFKSPIPLLQKKTTHSISVSQEKLACMLANAFLCTFPKQENVPRGIGYSEINSQAFIRLRARKLHRN